MFRIIHQGLQLNEMYGISDEIDIAKGVNKYPENLTDIYRVIKRKIMSNQSDKEKCGNTDKQ